MNLRLRNFDELTLRGIYSIKNVSTGKRYVGSASITVTKRLQHHLAQLLKGVHKNQYLQNAWNKYGEDDFVFEVIENCAKEECLPREQFWLDYYQKEGPGVYNINKIASGTSGMSEETIKYRSDKIREFYQEVSKYYKQVKNGELTISDIPRKYRRAIFAYFQTAPNSGQIMIGKVPWNKGRKYKSTDHLKVPKAKKGDQTNRLKALRERLPKIYVYNEDLKYLGTWENTVELTKNSIDENFPLKEHMKFRNPQGRNGYSQYLLQGCNINRSATYNISYKGLYFKHRPLHQETDVDKLDKNGEG